ncbi:unnamed protein product [Dimorphilus gyrociliatus]|uniref:Homeobox domain-containing protein n=1 Tax=Dimorphilus gyrociliatus TaxID=2664684 RepID=A0A7I8VV51_9ANNE|nr:unnamed protein product [Dimorphilus gyrociliatus]
MDATQSSCAYGNYGKTANVGPERTRSSCSKLKRIRFSPTQLRALETVFAETQYPDAAIISALAGRMNIPMEKICTWFQNRRSRFRKESKNGHIEMMRRQVFATNSNNNSQHVLSPPPLPPQPNSAIPDTSPQAQQQSCMYSQLQVPAYDTPNVTGANYSTVYPY